MLCPAKLGPVEDVAEKIAAMLAVNYVVRIFGSRDVCAEFRCASIDDLFNARARVAALDDVLGTDFFEFASESIKNPVCA